MRGRSIVDDRTSFRAEPRASRACLVQCAEARARDRVVDRFLAPRQLTETMELVEELV
jgi:hypothetical protein